MYITAIKAQVKNAERVSIFVDGKYAFSLTLSELLGEKLKVGLELNEPAVKRLKKLSDDGKLKNRALEWVLNRPRSLREFNNYLYRKKAEPELIEKLASEFEHKGYLSDRVFAEWLIDLRRRTGKSERVIRAELASKGVPKEIVEECLVSDGDELGRLQRLVEKKRHLTKYKADPQKFMQYLARQGFGYDDIKTVLKADD